MCFVRREITNGVITLSTMQLDTKEKRIKWPGERRIIAITNCYYQFSKYCDFMFVTINWHFHSLTVYFYIIPFTSERLSAGSSSSLLVFPVRLEQEKNSLSYFLHCCENGLELSNTHWIFKIAGRVTCKSHSVVSSFIGFHYAKKHSTVTIRLAETSSGQAVLMVSDGETCCVWDWLYIPLN